MLAVLSGLVTLVAVVFAVILFIVFAPFGFGGIVVAIFLIPIVS